METETPRSKVEMIQKTLPTFTGTEQWHRYGQLSLTDGALYICTEAGAFWMADIISSYQSHPKIKGQLFQVYDFKRNGKNDQGINLEISDGNYNVLATQRIEFCDFPLDEFAFWCVGGTVLLPSEY